MVVKGVRPMVMPPIVTSAFAGTEVKAILRSPLAGAGADKTVGWEDVGTDAAIGVNVLAIGALPLLTVVVGL